MANMQATKTPMPEQDPNVRNKNFKEVTLGYTAEMAINEAKRCLQCTKPHCVEGCPVNIHIPEFIHEVAEGNFEKAYEIITDTNALPALSGRVCPQETQCESKCVRGNKGEPVAIGRLERVVADWYRENINAMPKKAESNGIKVAVVGSGPSGLTCASLLAKKGYAVSLFEALHTAGGVLVYGIPEFRLPKAIVANEVEKLKAQGVEVMTDMVIGKVLSIDELFEMGFKAVFIGSGAGLPMFMHIPGESLKGVCSANEVCCASLVDCRDAIGASASSGSASVSQQRGSKMLILHDPSTTFAKQPPTARHSSHCSCSTSSVMTDFPASKKLRSNNFMR